VHELSIATSVVENLTRKLADQPGQVVSVQLRIGVLSGVVPDALRFAWDIVCLETRLEGSQLVIEEVEARILCGFCNAEEALPGPIPMLCPHCGKPVTDIIAGRELEIHSVEVSEDEQRRAQAH
jgi:hydrogenase nickel incorporation protein HypA/HybF